MIKAIISDLDGVIRNYPSFRDKEFEIRFSLPAGSLIQCTFMHSDLSQVVTGKISDKQWRQNIASRLKLLSDGIDANQIVKDWSEFPGLLDMQVMELLKKHKVGRTLILMTNATDKLELDLRKLNILDQFDSIINSSNVGFAKPDKEIFIHTLKKLDLAAAETLFIDDRQENLAAAGQLGFQCHHFTTVDSLKLTLEQM